MSFLRFLMLLALVAWIGGLIFFAFVVAPTAFSPGLLPSRDLAGALVGRSLAALHWMGIACGIVFLFASTLYGRLSKGAARPLSGAHIAVIIMLILTAMSQFVISPRMHSIRTQTSAIDTLPPESPARAEFNRLHMWSERFEESVLLLGLITIYLTARRTA